MTLSQPVALTGIAANLLINGRTSHVTFKLPLNINDESTCNISPNSEYGIKLRNVKVIIWDKITMTSKIHLKLLINYSQIFVKIMQYLVVN